MTFNHGIKDHIQNFNGLSSRITMSNHTMILTSKTKREKSGGLLRGGREMNLRWENLGVEEEEVST